MELLTSEERRIVDETEERMKLWQLLFSIYGPYWEAVGKVMWKHLGENNE